jgi:4-fold beta flower protein
MSLQSDSYVRHHGHDLARALAPRYARARRREKSQLLDEFCALTGYTRKHALVLLSHPPADGRVGHVGGRPRSYGPAEVALLRMCWSATDGICSKRLAPFLPELLERLRRWHALRHVSAKTIKVDDESTIYMWDGRPVAYLYDSGISPDSSSIYNFDGNHLGWLNKGIVRDHNGYAIGFLKGTATVPTQFEPFKRFREFEPFKGFREFAPARPADIQQWSATPLSVFLTKALSPA